MSLAEYTEALLSLTSPVPSAVRVPGVLNAAHISTESDLGRNPHQFAKWLSHINSVRDDAHALHLEARGARQAAAEAVLGPRLATADDRLALQKLVDVYERALAAFPASFRLWRDYLAVRAQYVLGTPGKQVKLDAPRKREQRPMLEWLEAGSADYDELDDGERDINADFDDALDPVAGFDEWRSLAAAYERAIMRLPRLPRLWLDYCTMFLHPACPSVLAHTHARRTFDRALRTLPPSLHERVWRVYLLWAERVASPEACVRVWRRYLRVDPSPTPHYVDVLLKLGRPLEAAKMLLTLSRKAQEGSYKDPKGRGSFHLFVEFLDVCQKHVDVGLELGDADATDATTEVDATDGQRLNVEQIVRQEGIEQYKDQTGALWSGLATYWTNKGELEHAREIFDEGVRTVVTVRDFEVVFNAYTNFIESMISGLMEILESGEADDGDELEVDGEMRKLEDLIDRRPFLINDVHIRRNPNDVQEWEKRVALHGENDEAVAETYMHATKTINPRKTTGPFHLLWVHFAKFFEQGGVSREAEPDLEQARKVFERATAVPFRKVDELAEIWIEWAEMEVRNENYDEAIKVMQRATQVPRKKVSYHDESAPPQQRLHKSMKLWSYFIDLEESIGTVESTKAAYEKVFDLKIANAQVVINCANFLEENQYWEESFKVYERGVELFSYPIAFEIWNTYLTKFLKRYGGDKIERARDLFEQALDECPPKFAKPLYLLYGHMEEEHGLAKRAMAVYDRATRAVELKDRMEMYTYYIAKAAENFGLPATRPIYERAIEVLPDQQTAEMCLRFAALERKLGEIDRARAIYAHASQFCDPRTSADFWATWNKFEIETGSEDTFREYLRIKRAVQASFNTDASYISSKAAAVKQNGAVDVDDAVAEGVDPMAALEAQTGAAKMNFVPAKDRGKLAGTEQEPQETGNADEIALDDDDDE